METKRRNTLMMVALAAVAATSVGVYFWIKNAAYETTDNAQVDGNIVPLRSSVTAYIDRIYFKDNQQVHMGDTLLVFNTTVVDAKVAQARAALENARANLSVSDIRAMASHQNALASEQTAHADQQRITAAKADEEKAGKDLARVKALLQVKGATQEQYEAAQHAYEVAHSAYEQTVNEQTASYTTSAGLSNTAQAEKGQISVAQAMVKQREAELALALDDQHHAYIVAPFDGIVTRRSVQQGQYIAAGQTLAAMIDTRNVWISANFKETQLHRLQPGQPVEISVDAYPGLVWAGKIDSYTGATGAKFSLLPPDNATGNYIKITQRFPVRVSIDANTQPAVLYPGLSAFLKVKTK
jgi:membrane fusion protein, multidrug efflux system